MRVSLYTDGGVRGGNPGLAALGFVIRDDEGREIGRGGFLLEGKHTSNEAEYAALISGLWNAHQLGATSVDVYTDSQLVHGQMTGEFAVRQANIAEFVEEVQIEESKFVEVTYTWLKRSANKEADGITRTILDQAMEGSDGDSQSAEDVS